MTEYVFLQGKAKWVKADKPNKWDKWSCMLYPNTESLDKIRELQSEGIKNVLKKDDDGYFTTFSRPTSAVIQGKVRGFEPPELLEADGKTKLRHLVGNGSDVTIKLEVYSHGTPNGGKAKAARLQSIRVDNLVPYEMNRDFDEDQKKLVKGLADQPEQLF